MTEQAVLSRELLDAIVAIAKQAGEAILQVYHAAGELEIQSKADDSPLTQADLASHRVIVQGLEALSAEGKIPVWPVLSEEGELPDFAERSQWDTYWIIDPLDGTKEFINRNGEFTVNIALVTNHRPVLGVVYVPVKGIGYFAAEGIGAFKEAGDRCTVIQARKLAERGEAPVTVVASRRHGAEAVEAMMGKIREIFGECTTTNMGSSLKICLVAEGAADLYPRLALTSEWDTAAAQAVLEAAGGTLVNAETLEPLRYNTKADILNPYFHAMGDQVSVWKPVLEPQGNA